MDTHVTLVCYWCLCVRLSFLYVLVCAFMYDWLLIKIKGIAASLTQKRHHRPRGQKKKSKSESESKAVDAYNMV